MKFELNTENKVYSKSFFSFFVIIFIITLIILLFDNGLKLGIISRHYEIEYNCRLLSVEKSTSTFKKLSKILNLKSKVRIWEFCREVVK